MAYYGSNYPSNSGPPPPGMAGGPYNNFGQGYSAYNNHGGYAAYPGGQMGGGGFGGGGFSINMNLGGMMGGMFGGGGGGYQQAAVPGFTAPMPQSYQQPTGMAPPQSSFYGQAHQMQQQRGLQEMQWQQCQQMGLIEPDEEEEEMKRRRRRRRHKVDDDEDEDFDEEEEKRKMQERMERAEAKAKELQEKLANDEGARENLRQLFIREMQRRQALSGTFTVTQGTVFPFTKYDDEDLICQWYKSEKDTDISGEEWNAEYDCEYVRKAIKGWGTDEEAIIYLCSSRCQAQRNAMLKMYKTMYGRDLIKDLRGDTSGNFRDALIMMFYSPAHRDAYEIKKAIYGLGTDEQTLIEILLTRTNAQIQEMIQDYNAITYEKLSRPETSLEQDIIDDCSGDFKALLISAAQGNRKVISDEEIAEAVEPILVDGNHTGMFQLNEEKLVNIKHCKRKAKELMEAGEERWGTDEETFNRIFSLEDHTSLRIIYNEYVKLSQRDIMNSVDRETSGDLRKGLLAIAQVIKHRPMFFADKLYKSMKGLGTNDDDLIRIVVTRSEMDMVQIKECFLEKYKQTLWNFIKDDTSGDYRKLLLGLVGKN